MPVFDVSSYTDASPASEADGARRSGGSECHPHLRSGKVARLEGDLQPGVGGGWSIRLPVRREEVSVSRQAVVAEEVMIRADREEDTVQVRDTVRREELRVDVDDSLEMTQRLDPPRRRA